MKFKLSRKKKKQFKKDAGIFFKIYCNKECWEWFYFKKRVDVRCMAVIIKYPEVATDEELLEWYKENYPNDKLSQHYCKQNRKPYINN